MTKNLNRFLIKNYLKFVLEVSIDERQTVNS